MRQHLTACLHFTWTVYLHTPRVFHNLMVLSREPETICRLSEEKATLNTSLVWPTNRRVVVPLRGRTWSLPRHRQALRVFLQGDLVLGAAPQLRMRQRIPLRIAGHVLTPTRGLADHVACHHQDPPR